MLSPNFPAVELPHLDGVPLPEVMRVRLPQPTAAPVVDVAAAVSAALARSQRLATLPPRAAVAVAVGSRGIADIVPIAAATVAQLKARGLAPFIVPAMGSHGGGSAAGQIAMLASLGVTEATVGAPIRATMEVVRYGATADGVPCCFDRNAAAAAAVVLLARVKSHTSFERDIESGLTKMTAVGLGKAEGARSVHLLGADGLSRVLPALADIAVANSPIAYGLALVENAAHRIVTVEGVEPADFQATDRRLLRQAKSLLARLPFDQIDVLVVELVGKDISGAAMDYAVTGRTDLRGRPNPARPFIHKIAVLGLTPASRGNALGLGVADYTTRAVANALDLKAMYMNAVTATFVEKAQLPVVLAHDRAALQASLATCWRLDPAAARYCQICSTLDLDEVLVSSSLYRDIDGQPGVAQLSPPRALAFDSDGGLLTRLRQPTAAAAQ